MKIIKRNNNFQDYSWKRSIDNHGRIMYSKQAKVYEIVTQELLKIRQENVDSANANFLLPCSAQKMHRSYKSHNLAFSWSIFA